MRVICSYCEKDLGEKPPLDDPLTSHGMCEDCAAWLAQQIEGRRLGELLDEMDRPTLVVGPNVDILAANQKMANKLGKSDRELHGLLGGQALECVRSRLPGGCGQTVHCGACTLRQAITHTATSGEPLHAVEAFVERTDGRITVRISTRNVGEFILVSLDEDW